MKINIMEYVIQGILFIVFGGFLILVNIWIVQIAYRNFFSSGVVISPFEVLGGGSPEQSRTLANLLQARLSKLQADLERVQISLISHKSTSIPINSSMTNNGYGKPDPPLPLLWSEPINLNSKLLDSFEINVTVGGVEVGKLVSWFQRTVAHPQSLNFTIVYEESKTIIAGVKWTLLSRQIFIEFKIESCTHYS